MTEMTDAHPQPVEHQEVTIHPPEPPIAIDGLVVFASQFCPFCSRVKNLFEALGVAPTYLDVEDPANKEQYEAAVARTGQQTVPMVLLKDKLLGGCDDMCVAVESGDIQRLLDLPSMHAAPRPSQPRQDLVSPGFISFSPLVNIFVVRLISIQVCIISIVLIVFRDEPWAWWVCFGMTLDFVARFMFAGSSSVLGSVAAMLLFWKEEELVPGPPKQFAALVGIVMYAAATIMFHAGDETFVTWVLAPISLGMVGFFAFLEGGFNFCAGCYIFSLLNKWGWIKNTIYQPYTDSYNFIAYGVREMNTKLGWVDNEGMGGLIAERDDDGNRLPTAADNPLLVSWRRRLFNLSNRSNGSALPRPIRVSVARDPTDEVLPTDIHYKFPKIEEVYRELWGWKYVSFPDFSIVLGIGGFALVLKNVDHVFDTPSNIWKVIAVFAAVVFGCLLFCLIAKLFLYPNRIFMDFQNPMRRNASALVPICFMIFSGLAANIDFDIQMIMWWMGAPLSALGMVMTLVYYIRNRQSQQSYNPGVLIPMLSNFVVAVVTPSLTVNQSAAFTAAYMEAAQWFFGFSMFYWILHMATTMYHGIFFHWSNDKMRPMIAIWMGACFIANIAYMRINNYTKFDTFAFAMYSSGVCLFAAIVYLIYPGRWLMVGPFGGNHWGVAFPLNVFAISSVLYYTSQGTAFALGMCWVSFIAAGFANFCFTCHTILHLLQRKWPGPFREMDPLGFNKVIHDGLKEVMVRLRTECEADREPNDNKPMTVNTAKRFLELAYEFINVLRVHQRIKREFVFPEIKSVNKAHVTKANAQSLAMENVCADVQSAIDHKDAVRAKAVLAASLDEILNFLDWQEDHLWPLVLKGLNSKISALIMQRVWEHIDLDDLELVVCFTFRYVPKQMYRVRFIKGITAVLPERCQQVGLWLYRGAALDPLGDIKFSMLMETIPEVVPRGLGLTWTMFM